MTIEEAQAEVEKARRQAHASARKLYAPAIGPTGPIVDAARLVVLEALIVGIIARESNYAGTPEIKVLMELRDYWETVAEEIEKAK